MQVRASKSRLRRRDVRVNAFSSQSEAGKEVGLVSREGVLVRKSAGKSQCSKVL